MKINRAELLSALEKVRPGLSNKENIEQSTSFAFMGDRVVTYNDEISISHPITGLNVTGAVKAQTLFDFLGRVKQEEIELTWEENQVVIQAGRAKAGLVMEQEVTLPVEEIGKIGKWIPFPEDAMDGLKFCYPRCGSDMIQMDLTCVHVTPTRMEASDSYQIAMFNLDKKLPVKAFLLPAAAARELVKYDVKQMSQGESWVHFKTDDGTLFSSRTLMGGFRNIDQYLNIQGDSFHFPKNMVDVLKRADVFAKTKISAENRPMVDVTLDKNEIHMSVESDHGWFKEHARIKYDGEPAKFSIAVELLLDILGATTQGIINDNLMVFRGEKWQHIIAMSPCDKK